MFEIKKFLSRKFPSAYLNYLENTPNEICAQHPLIISIHGAGSRGSDLSEMARIGPLKDPVTGDLAKAVIVAPNATRTLGLTLFMCSQSL